LGREDGPVFAGVCSKVARTELPVAIQINAFNFPAWGMCEKLAVSLLAGVPALVLGAGFGTRLRPLTEHIPKPVIPLLGRPLIGHPLIHLYAAGCTQVHWSENR